VYGDASGNLDRAVQTNPEAIAVVLEWADLDPRLGWRHLGGWAPPVMVDILSGAANRLQQFERSIIHAAESVRVVVSMPTLPLPPCFCGPIWEESGAEASLRETIAASLQRVSGMPDAIALNQQQLNLLSPLNGRHDLRAELQTGFPYRQPHADALASMLAAAIIDRPPLKGIITDLDDTLWKGLLGEIGVQSVCWDLAGRAQFHGLYQQLLEMLASRGVLIAIASKNNPELVEAALARPDFLLAREHLYPVEASWGSKSDSVRRVLEAWNVGPDAVVFVDDNPMEIAEVKFAFPEIQCCLFPTDDAEALLTLLDGLRDRFGRRAGSTEDQIRIDSIRTGNAMRSVLQSTGSPDAFLQQSNANLIVTFGTGSDDARAFELVNKTNQFNMNGLRFTSKEWRERLRQPHAFLCSVSYQDKFGSLGKIAVMIGTLDGANRVVRLEVWVMSCRAFSRRIEYQSLRQVFEKFQAREIVLDFVPTPRNEPFREFLINFGDITPFRITREQFEAKCPPLYHVCQEATVG
jgi:FkbH-like protein